MPTALSVIPVQAPVQDRAFDLIATIQQALQTANVNPQDGDVLALSSKYVAISEGRIVQLADVVVGDQAQELALRYNMNPTLAQLVVQEAEHIFGGIPLGFLLTWREGVISPNAGIDRSNIPNGKAVLLPKDAYGSAEHIRQALQAMYGVKLGILLTDSWLVPGRWGTTGVALSMAGFEPLQDERGKLDLFGNPMAVTQRSIADTLCVAAQLVMGERDEATPIALVRNAPITLTERVLSRDDVAIPWEMCLYVESLTLGLLPDGAPRESISERLHPKKIEGV
jgi:coenzyme F420-0:L-glutamate ligase / coenzyme F420-1:gamma-L-glutamate ligase